MVRYLLAPNYEGLDTPLNNVVIYLVENYWLRHWVVLWRNSNEVVQADKYLVLSKLPTNACAMCDLMQPISILYFISL